MVTCTKQHWYAIPSGSTSVSAYFPAAKWYDWYTHQVTSSEGGETKQLDTPVDHIQVWLDIKVRYGKITSQFICAHSNIPNPKA